MKPFLPAYIPAVGEVDAFLKVPRPDGKEDGLGLRVLDESLQESDRSVVTMQLLALSKDKSAIPETLEVRCIENAKNHPDQVDAWISSIARLHDETPLPVVRYTGEMPDIETLMQLWSKDVSEILYNEPGARVSTTNDFARRVLAFLDIPVHKSLIQSLHLFFTLYLEVKNNQHFAATSQ